MSAFELVLQSIELSRCFFFDFKRALTQSFRNLLDVELCPKPRNGIIVDELRSAELAWMDVSAMHVSDIDSHGSYL